MLNADSNTVYDEARAAILKAAADTLEQHDGQGHEATIFSAAAEALFTLMFEGFVSQGHSREEAAAKTQFWWSGYVAHLAQQAAQARN